MLTSNMGRKKCDPTPSSEAGLSPFIQFQELPRTPAPGIHALPAPVSASSKAKGTSPPTEVLEQRGLGPALHPESRARDCVAALKRRSGCPSDSLQTALVAARWALLSWLHCLPSRAAEKGVQL
ncbi:hypothetical protein Y1Q_0021142 [Alligator mississippiensis]|uniref:Uncharacterized protein n=1 Tax=Alligator mississippiensis TaxID=8496 RepID=A0A151NCP6_ALLMI|nr:hypothetical protein Y1Q_0021142 [Alligator mississippiensis]